MKEKVMISGLIVFLKKGMEICCEQEVYHTVGVF